MLYEEQTDDTLVALTLAGNEQAYEALVIRYQKAVLSAAYSILHNAYLAEDAAQDAFVSAWIKLDRLREPAKFPAWVCRIAKNSAKNLVVRYRDHVSMEALRERERAAALAQTPRQIAHTQVACRVMRRILETDPTYSPAATAKGHWNFFLYLLAETEDGAVRVHNDFSYSFEWKDMAHTGDAGYPLLFNDVYNILQEAAGAIWSDKWTPGFQTTYRIPGWKDSEEITTTLACEEAGTVVTAAGRFDNCRKLSLNITGLSGGLAYRGGRKEYIFAPGIGILRTTNWRDKDGCPPTVYELTAYTGTGEGYMPLGDGFRRRYEALGLTDGFVGATEYTYVADEDGSLVMLTDLTGLRQ